MIFSSQVAISFNLAALSPYLCVIGGGGLMFASLFVADKQPPAFLEIKGEGDHTCMSTKNSPVRIGLYCTGVISSGVLAAPLF